MKISLGRPNGTQAEFKLDKLVTTIGFGEGCDIQLDGADRPQRIGMFIRQDRGYCFKSLLNNGEILYGGMPVVQMIDNADQAGFSHAGYTFRLFDEEQFVPAQFEKLDRLSSVPRPQSASVPAHINFAGARNAYQREVQAFERRPEPSFATRPITSPQPAPQAQVRRPVEPPKTNPVMEGALLKKLYGKMDEAWLDIVSERERHACFVRWVHEEVQVRTDWVYPDEDLLQKMYVKLCQPEQLKALLVAPDLIDLRLFGSGEMVQGRWSGRSHRQGVFANPFHLYWEVQRFLAERGIELDRAAANHQRFQADRMEVEIVHSPGAWRDLLVKISMRQQKSLEHFVEAGQLLRDQHAVIREVLGRGERVLVVVESGLPVEAYYNMFVQECARMGYVASIDQAPATTNEQAPSNMSDRCIPVNAQDVPALVESMDLYNMPYIAAADVVSLFQVDLIRELVKNPVGVMSSLVLKPGEDVSAKLMLLLRLHANMPEHCIADIVGSLMQIIVRVQLRDGDVRFSLSRLEVAGEGSIIMSDRGIKAGFLAPAPTRQENMPAVPPPMPEKPAYMPAAPASAPMPRSNFGMREA